MEHLACTLPLGLLVACGADKSGERTGTGAVGTSTTGAATDAPDCPPGTGCLPVLAGGVCTHVSAS